MHRQHNPDLVDYARELRKNMTKEEKQLWYEFLKELPVQFYKQRIIGPYIVDFCCPSKKLVIELDGSQHYEDSAKVKDILRDNKLSELGFTVKRYTNLDIKFRFKEVCEDIYNYLFLDLRS